MAKVTVTIEGANNYKDDPVVKALKELGCEEFGRSGHIINFCMKPSYGVNIATFILRLNDRIPRKGSHTQKFTPPRFVSSQQVISKASLDGRDYQLGIMVGGLYLSITELK